MSNCSDYVEAYRADAQEYDKARDELYDIHLPYDIDVMLEAKAKDDALFRLIRELKYKTDYNFIDETSFEI